MICGHKMEQNEIDSTRVVQILLTHEIENKWNYVFHQYDGLNHKYVNIHMGSSYDGEI